MSLTSSAGSVANIYSTVPGSNPVDAYRNHSNDPASPLDFSGTDASSQIALVNRGTNTLIRMPYNPVPPSAPPGMNMMGGVGGIGLGQAIGPPGQGDGMDPFDRELQMRIDKMRKKRASIPPFVQKLSRYARICCLCFYPVEFCDFFVVACLVFQLTNLGWIFGCG